MSPLVGVAATRCAWAGFDEAERWSSASHRGDGCSRAQGFAAQTTAYTSRVSESRGCVMVGKSIIGGCYTGLLATGCDLRYRCKQHSMLSMFFLPCCQSCRYLLHSCLQLGLKTRTGPLRSMRVKIGICNILKQKRKLLPTTREVVMMPFHGVYCTIPRLSFRISTRHSIYRSS